MFDMIRAGCVALAIGACAGNAVEPGARIPVAAVRPEDRVLLGDFLRVNAVASTLDRVYVAYPSALGIWRPLERRWEVPRSPPDPREMARVRAAIVDPLDRSVWLATSDGWLRYAPESDRWDRGMLPGRVTAVAVDPVNPARGVWFRTTSGWVVQPAIGPGSVASPPQTLQPAPTLDDAMRDLPQLRGVLASALVGSRMAGGQPTSVAPASTRDGWYVGTTNRGLLFFDRFTATPVPLGLGLPGEIIGALVATGDGVWVATDATRETPAGLTFVNADLSGSVPISGMPTRGLTFDFTRRMVAGDRTLWLGTDRGLVRVAIDGDRLEQWDEGDGLPDQRVTALVQRRERVIVGTMRGLAEVQRDSTLRRHAPAFSDAVFALAARGDTAWVGTNRGLFALVANDGDIRMPEGFRRLTGIVAPVLGIGYHADTLVAMTPERLLWRDPTTGAWTAGPVLSTELGRLTVLDATAHGLWVGGLRAAGLVRPTTGVVRSLRVPAEIPGQVTTIANDGTYLWIGTPAGLVRFLLSGR